MIVMQYGFTLPADYDMEIIERRIRDKGHLLDGFPGLGFKAYLSADRRRGGTDNLYAPYYFWKASSGADRFLSGPGFAALSRDFGRPAVKTAIVWHAALGKNLSEGRFASCDVDPILPHSDLETVRAAEIRRAQEALDDPDMLACVTAYDPTAWTCHRFRLSRTPLRPKTERTQFYDVGYVALP